MTTALEQLVDAVAESAPGVAEVYESTRPIGGRLAMRKLGLGPGTRSFVRGIGAVAEVTVSVGLRPDADATAVRDALATGIRAIDGLEDARVHIRISRVQYEESGRA
jgi:hypothetical protein